MDKEQILSVFFKFSEKEYVNAYDKKGELIPELSGRIISIDSDLSNRFRLTNFTVRVRSLTTGEIHDVSSFSDRLCVVKKMKDLPIFYEDQEIFINKFNKDGYKALVGTTIMKVDEEFGDTTIELNNGCILSITSGYSDEFDTTTHIDLLTSFGDNT